MKNLKFRIWDKQLKNFLFQLPEQHHLDWERFDVQQFTGLLDKQSKEIYEGDVVRAEDPQFESEVYNYVVEFIGGCFVITKKDWPAFYLAEFEDIEVIGNIYSNPELLK